MKKIIIGIVALAVCIGVLCGLNIKEENDYIRIHIRANSNSEYDQNIKYLVKDEVVKFITPLAKDITSIEKMHEILNDNLAGIKTRVDKKLIELGQNYDCNVKLNKEDFPTRTYQDLTLEGGIYDALIIELGSGSGDNWWCVAFPPLCFVGENTGKDEFEYKSIFEDWFGNK